MTQQFLSLIYTEIGSVLGHAPTFSVDNKKYRIKSSLPAWNSSRAILPPPTEKVFSAPPHPPRRQLFPENFSRCPPPPKNLLMLPMPLVLVQKESEETCSPAVYDRIKLKAHFPLTTEEIILYNHSN